jgi:acetolactate synthase I/II/III large subunit
MKGTEFILHSLVADGIDHLFLVPGGLVDPFLPALQKVPEIHPVVAAQEGGAAYMADGYARAGGRFGACLVIGGPGLTNTVTAVSAAFVDGSPILVLSGEVASYMEGLGIFQDATAGTFNDMAMLSTVTAESYSIPDPRLLHHRYRGALKRMFGDISMPVHLSLPTNVATGDIAVPVAPVAPALLRVRTLDVQSANDFWSHLIDSDGERVVRVAILAGADAMHDGAPEALCAVAEQFQIPVATTQIAKGTFPEDHELSFGVFGYAGTRHATLALLERDLDLLIVLGAAFNQRDSMHWSSKLTPRNGIFTVNSSAINVGCHGESVTFVRGHAGAFLDWLLAAPSEKLSGLLEGASARKAWIEEIRAAPRHYDAENCASGQIPIHPARLIAECRRALPRDTIALVDSGAHRAFAVHYWESYGPREFLTAAGLGPMGWAIPAAVGAKAARPASPVVVFTGDGCMQMHGIEIQSAARFNLPVIFIVLNNAALGNVWLRAHTEGPVPARLTEIPDHDWAGFARALGVDALTVHKPDMVAQAVEQALHSGKAFLIDVKAERNAPTPIEPYRQAAQTWSYQE